MLQPRSWPGLDLRKLKVQYTPKQTETGDLVEMSGTVKKVFNDPKEGLLLILETTEGDYTLGLDGIISVGN